MEECGNGAGEGEGGKVGVGSGNVSSPHPGGIVID